MSKQSEAIIRQVNAGKNVKKALSKAKKLVANNPKEYPELEKLLDGNKSVEVKEPVNVEDKLKELEERIEKLENKDKKK